MRREAGFTLIEFFIVLTILGILGFVFYGAYQDSLKHEANAKQHETVRQTQRALRREEDLQVSENISEKCIDGYVYFTFVRDGTAYSTAKVDKSGYNVRCSH